MPKAILITLSPDNGSREGADNGSSGAKQKYVPLVAFPSSSSQISGGASQIPGADAERYKLSYLDWGSNDDDGIDWSTIAKAAKSRSIRGDGA